MARRQQSGPGVLDSTLLLEGVLHRIKAGTTPILKDAGLTTDQWRVLDCLVRGGEIPMTELAADVLIPAPTVTRIVDRLVSGAVVYRSAAMKDRRRVLVHASRRGEELHRRLVPDVSRVEAEAFRALSDEQRQGFVELLQMLNRPV